jgi:glycosyltransferase involved in cell wall biosynthesis
MKPWDADPRETPSQTDKSLLIISYEEASSHNGLNTRMKGIVRALSAAGRHIEIAAPFYGSKVPDAPADLEGAPIHSIPMPNLLRRRTIPIVTRVMTVAFLTMGIVRRLRKSPRRFASVQSEQAYPFIAAYVLARRWGATLILDDPSLLGCFVEEKLRRRRILGPLLKRSVEAFETALWRRADYILSSSRRTAGEIERRIRGARTKVVRLGNGVDLEEFVHDSNGRSGNRIFFNCSVPYYQNLAALQNLLRIFDHFEKRAFRDYHATVVVNDASAIPREMVRQIESNPRVRLLSNQKSLVPWLLDSDVVLLPYEKGHLTTAGPRLKVFEALACGKIVLGTKEGLDEIPECEDGRNVILCSDWADMASKTMALIAEGETSRKAMIRSEARKLVESQYSWQRLVSAYDPILGAASG